MIHLDSAEMGLFTLPDRTGIRFNSSPLPYHFQLVLLLLCFFKNVSKYDSSSVSGAIGPQEPGHETESVMGKHWGSALVVTIGRTQQR